MLFRSISLEWEEFPRMHFPSSILCQLWHHHVRPADLSDAARAIPPPPPPIREFIPLQHHHQLLHNHHHIHHHHHRFVTNTNTTIITIDINTIIFIIKISRTLIKYYFHASILTWIIFSFSWNLFESSRNSFWNWFNSTYWTYRWSWRGTSVIQSWPAVSTIKEYDLVRIQVVWNDEIEIRSISVK